MRNTLLIAILVYASCAHGQTDIADARTYPVGSMITVTGTVTNGSELGLIRYIQDGSAGIACYPGSGSVAGFTPTRGSIVQITGEVDVFNGLLQINPISSFTILGNGPLPAPKTVKASEINEHIEGQLVKLDHCLFNNGGLFFTQNEWRFRSLGRSAEIYLGNGHELISTPIPSDHITLRGIVSQYDPGNGARGFRILPRDSSDVIRTTPVHITDRVKQRNTTGSSFEIYWSTNVPSSSVVEYGPSPVMGNVVANTTLTTDHSVFVTGLPFPGLRQWLRAGCIVGTDTVWSTVNRHTTMFPSSGEIRTWFTQPVDQSVSQGTDATFVFDSMDDTLAQFMDQAVSTIEVAVYNNTNGTLVSKLNDAYNRGVQIRFITEGQNTNSVLNNLDPGIPVLVRSDGAGSGMHNKFMLVDAQDNMNAWLLQGSSNWTSSLSNDANNQFAIQDRTLAEVYLTEFEEMWGSSGPLPDPSNSRFGADKVENTPHFFTVGGVEIECYFSPTESVTDRIIELIEGADDDVHFATFSYTEDNIRNAMILSDPNLPGRVHGMIDQVGGSELFTLQSAGIDVVSVANIPGLLHHKYLIADKTISNVDPVVLTGSHNFSFNAASVNDENTLIIHDPSIADQFYQDWHERRSEVVSVEETKSEDLHLWPNPSSDKLFLEGFGSIRLIEIFDLTGKLIARSSVPSNTVDISEYPAGFYRLSVTDDDRSIRSFSFIKE